MFLSPLFAVRAAQSWLAVMTCFALPVVNAADVLQKKVGDDFVTRLEQAKTARRSGDLKTARELFSKLSADVPGGYFRAEYNLGLMLTDGKPKGTPEFDAGIAALEKARAIQKQENVEDYSIYSSLAWTYDAAGMAEKASAAYDEAVTYKGKLTPEDNRRLFTNAGIFFYTRGNLEKANPLLKIAATDYNSDTAKRFLASNEKLMNQINLSKEVNYTAKLSKADKQNSKGVSLIEASKADGDEATLREILLQDRYNYYRFNLRDPEDTDSPLLEEPSFNRLHFPSRKIVLGPALTYQDIFNGEVVVNIKVTKTEIQVSRK